MPTFRGDTEAFIEHSACLYASKIISYAQGFMLMRQAATEYQWKLNYGGMALMWRGGCIIRSQFLGKIKEAYNKNPELKNLLLDDFSWGRFKSAKWMENSGSHAAELGIPIPCFSAAYPSTTGIAPLLCLPTFFRLNGIILALIPMKG